MAADTGHSADGRAPRPVAARRGQTGFTLVEMLVSLVILGFVMSLVSEAVFQVAQVTRAAEATTRGLAARWGAGWTAGSLFANLLAPELDGEAPVLSGHSQRIDGYTSVPLDGADQGITPFALELRPGGIGGSETEMHAVPAEPVFGQAEASALVAVFPGRAEFAFVGRDDLPVAQWPSLTRTGFDAEDLPKAVLVRDAASGALLMWYGFPGETQRKRTPKRPFPEVPR